MSIFSFRKTVLAIFFAALIVGGVYFASRSYFTTNIQGGSWLTQAREHGEIPDKIKEGIAMLKSSAPLQYMTTNGSDSGALIRKQIALSILDTNTGELFERRVWVTTSDINTSGATGLVRLTPDPAPVGKTRSSGLYDNLDIYVQWWNSFNTLYAINHHPELIVVANKYLIERKYLPEQMSLALTSNGPKGKYFDMVYAPYSELLHVPQIVDAGRHYVNESVAEAYEELKKARVASRMQAGKLVTDTVSPDLIKNIIVIEHVDPHWIWLADDGGRKLAERVLVIVGANQEWAFRYTGSTAGANGLAQFIEPTYYGIAAAYPSANLIKDFRYGMADHVNAVKAMVLYFDLHENQLQNQITRKDVLAQLGITDGMLAAAYNGGPFHVVQAVNGNGLAWAKSSAFPLETTGYIQKYDLIKKLKLFN